MKRNKSGNKTKQTKRLPSCWASTAAAGRATGTWRDAGKHNRDEWLHNLPARNHFQTPPPSTQDLIRGLRRGLCGCAPARFSRKMQDGEMIAQPPSCAIISHPQLLAVHLLENTTENDGTPPPPPRSFPNLTPPVTRALSCVAKISLRLQLLLVGSDRQPLRQTVKTASDIVVLAS